ncbi:MAG: hypothetical protein ACQCN6_03040 [Candidatus Bathyarchaeia archaeon]|jgi:amino acid transporter
MHNKGIFALAAVFLIVAIVVPIVYFVLGSGFNDLIVVQNPTGMQTNGNITDFTPQNEQENSRNNLFLVLVVEVIFVLLFIVTVYYGIRHVHPYH